MQGRLKTLPQAERIATARMGGQAGGPARAKKLTAKRRREIAAMGGRNSWRKVKNKKI